MANGKKVIKKSDWVASFSLIGEAKIKDYTFKIDERNNKSNWIYNSMNLGVWCGEKCGTVYSEILGGYSEDKESKIYAHGKDENGNDDFNKRIVVDFEDRFNAIHNIFKHSIKCRLMCFLINDAAFVNCLFDTSIHRHKLFERGK